MDPASGTILPETEPDQWLSTQYYGTASNGLSVWFYIGDDGFQDSSNFYPGQFAFQLENTSLTTPLSITPESFKIVISGLVTADGSYLSGFTALTDYTPLANDLDFAFANDVLTITAKEAFILSPGGDSALNLSGDFTAVPEPSTWALGAAATALLAVFARKRKA